MARMEGPLSYASQRTTRQSTHASKPRQFAPHAAAAAAAAEREQRTAMYAYMMRMHEKDCINNAGGSITLPPYRLANEPANAPPHRQTLVPSSMLNGRHMLLWHQLNADNRRNDPGNLLVYAYDAPDLDAQRPAVMCHISVYRTEFVKKGLFHVTIYHTPVMPRDVHTVTGMVSSRPSAPKVPVYQNCSMFYNGTGYVDHSKERLSKKDPCHESFDSWYVYVQRSISQFREYCESVAAGVLEAAARRVTGPRTLAAVHEASAQRLRRQASPPADSVRATIVHVPRTTVAGWGGAAPAPAGPVRRVRPGRARAA
jgi:hypothetical protein